MRYGNEEASTHRRAYDARPAGEEAPTFLPALAVPGAGVPYTQRSAHAPMPASRRTESVSRSRPRATPSDFLREPTESVSMSVPRATPPSYRREPTESVSYSVPSVAPRARAASISRHEPAPLPPPPVAAPAQPAPAPNPSAPQLGMIDPLAISIPPELGAPIYSWVRRLALQADLKTADRVLRDALCELTSSLSVSIVYPGQDGLWTLGADDEIPRDAAPIVAVAQARRALIAPHTALIPIVTTTETIAVVLLTRNPRNPAYLPVEQIAMIGLARESAAILHHLAVQHLQRATEIQADKGSLYRAEALHAHRNKGQEGSLVQLSPNWVKRAYPMLVGAIVVAFLFALFITVPTYSSGMGLVVLEGTSITAAAPGTVDQVLVQPGQAVKAGTVLVKMQAAAEMDELVNATTEHEAATRAFLFDLSDENVKKQLAGTKARFVTAQSKVNQRTIRATKAGTVSDIRVRPGNLMQPGDHILTIVEGGKTEPEVIAFLPATDRPRLIIGMPLQVELAGYTKSREIATITFVSPEAIGSNEAAKYVGATIADALKIPQGGSYVIVRARLPGRTFQTEHHTFSYHHGMQAKTEVKIASKPFLVSLLPALEKYIPE